MRQSTPTPRPMPYPAPMSLPPAALAPLLLAGSLLAETGPAAPAADPARAALLTAGHVAFVAGRAAAGDERGAATRFELSYAYGYRYRVRREDRGAGWRIAVTPEITGRVALRHVVELPGAPDDTAAAARRLLHHELDHVAISTDGRVALILERLMASMGTLERDLPAGTRLTDSLVRSVVDEAVSARKAAVQALVQAGYDRLDSLTRHGLEPLPDRRAFFEGLYSRRGLEEARFPWLAALGDLPESPEYARARRYALP